MGGFPFVGLWVQYVVWIAHIFLLIVLGLVAEFHVIFFPQNHFTVDQILVFSKGSF